MIKIEYQIVRPTILVPHNTGIMYVHQSAGVACYHHELEGYLIPVEVDRLCEHLFNPRVWYDQIGSVSLYDPKRHKYVPITAGNLIDEHDKHEQWYNRCVAYWWKGVFEAIEGCWHGLTIDRDIPHEEAWVEVQFDPEGGDKQQQAFFVWDNCD